MFRARTQMLSGGVLVVVAYLAACSTSPSQNKQPVTMSDGGGNGDNGLVPTTPEPEGEEEGEEALPDAGAPSDTGGPMDAGGPMDTAAPAADGGAALDTGTVSDVADVATTLSQAEIDLLVFTREEEKLARDVYTTIDFGTPIFDNIASSEQTHMDAVLTLLNRYSIPDPVGTNPVGVFTNPTLQALYDQLVAKGTDSPIDALQVGLQIEELDIRDLTAAMAVTDEADIDVVLENLLRGSRNHLRAFYDRLTAIGGTYTPQYLDEATFMAIATSPIETGGPPGY